MMQKLLKFRYFLWILVLVSCGEDGKGKEDTRSEVPGNGQTERSMKESPEGEESVEVESAGGTSTTSKTKTILFFGNSLTAGYGLDTQQAFPALIQDRLDSLGLNYTVINSGVSGETTSGGLNRLDWVLEQDIAVFVLELGANDGLRGVPLAETKKNLQGIIDAVHRKNREIKVILAGMQIPPNMGQEYTAEFRGMFPELAEKNDLELIPFLLEGVAGRPELNQEDGIHPTAAGQKILRDNVWQVLEDVISVE